MSAARRIVIVGGGSAGVAAALAAKQQDPGAQVVLLNDEHCEPYEKPPLSKAVLTGKTTPDATPIAGRDGIARSGVVLRSGTRVSEIDRVARALVAESGERLGYDTLVLATGSTNRALPMFPPARNGIHYLRTKAEALVLKEHLQRSRSLIVIGGGLIGLEVAASAVGLGLAVTVIEIAPRILKRVCDEGSSALIHARHSTSGVEIRVETAASAFSELPDGRLAVETQIGDAIVADLIVVGTGVAPDDSLAKAAGIAARDGIIVDHHGRTNDPAIFAAGDCARLPGPEGPVRLENWRHAQEHGAVVGRNAAGGDVTYNVAPSFWSEQFDMYIQGVGWHPKQARARVRRQVGAGASLLFELDGPHIAYAIGINAQRDIAVTRRLIERRVPVEAAELADTEKPIGALLKTKAQP